MLTGRDWRRLRGASSLDLTRLRNAAPVNLPERYYELLAFSDGGEGPLSRQPCYFVLDSVAEVLVRFAGGLNDEFFPGFLMFGTNGAGEYIAFDARRPPALPIVYIDMTNIDLQESVQPLASTFEEFLDLVGVESRDVQE